MRLFSIIIICKIFIISCSSYSNQELNYTDLNKRFNYEDLDKFKTSIKKHFNDNDMKLNLQKLNNINIIFSNNDYYKKVIENNNHEKYLENNPNDIYTIIIVIIDSDNNQKILFESMQAYLRYLSKDYVLR
tara:strand:+ start:371 stop:763 length:393 start_codon:yes stop_codon:yes gene_type:complete